MILEQDIASILNGRLGKEDSRKIAGVNNPDLNEFLAMYIELCDPDKVFVCADTPEDIQYIRDAAIRNGEEARLAIEGHTVHFDAYGDQGRDKENTEILVDRGGDIGASINTLDRDQGNKHIHEILKGIMKGKELYVCFFCLGPTDSEFSIACVQLTDSAYVAHSEGLLYRHGYEEFIRQGPGARFFKFVHSQGEVDERNVSKNLDRRRIYIDITDDTVYSTNTQYGGNTIGLKKPAMRLAINRASQQGWLCEHMLVMGIHGPGDRVTYFTGAYPSLCGKTSTAMMDGESMVGDDIAYLRKIDGQVRAVNAEKGMFGIIQGINSRDDSIQWEALHNPAEIIFSNVMVSEDGKPYWNGMGIETPRKGINYSGEWFEGKTDANGNKIPCSHPNARFTLDLHVMPNLDPVLDAPGGVVVKGIVYGGRDSDTCVPVEEAFNWAHGIITKGGSLESETTAATLGKKGVRTFNPMSNLDFISVPIGRYIQANLDFGNNLKYPPHIFSVNYFIRDKNTGDLLTRKTDKRIWFKWMELRVNGGADAIETPTGRIPKYEDLAPLFRKALGHDYRREDYNRQFTVRVPEHIAKIDRISNIYKNNIPDTPAQVFAALEAQRQRLLEAKEKHGNYITPDKL